MTRRKRLTQNQVLAIKPRADRYTVPDPELAGHVIRIAPTGARSFFAISRDPYGKQVWHKIGSPDVLDIGEARDLARDAIKRIKAGKSPVEPPPVKPDSYQAVSDNWVKRHVEAKKLRSGYEIERILHRYVFPHWGTRDFVDIRRSDIASLLDFIEDENGPRQADATLAVIRSIANWYSKRHDDYVSPFVRGMKRAAGKSRTRVLDDGELRKVWRQAESNGTFGAFVRMLLLTAQRRETVLRMRWSDISDGVWTIPKEDRAKGNAGSLQLPAKALAIIKALPEIKDNPFVFAGRGDGPINGISKNKAAFDKRSGVTGWTLHDLRRTSRSLLPRCGVRPDVAERLMGHALPGVEGIYDRFAYSAEKADTLKRLAALIDEIVYGERSGKVVRMRKARADA